MNTFKKSILGIITLAVVIFGGILFFAPGKASAEDITDLSKICVPQYTPKGDADHHKVNGWLQVSFIDRAHLKISYSANGECASPPGFSSSTFFGNRSFNQIFQDISGQSSTLLLKDVNGDSTVQYDAVVGDSGQDDTRIDQFGSALDDAMKDPLGGRDKIVNLIDLSNLLSGAEITLGLETDKVGYGCSSSVQNENFVLVDGNPPSWICVSSTDIGSRKGFVIGADNFSAQNNFNVTYTTEVNGDTITIKSVFENQQGDRTFTWCPGPKAFINKGCQGDLTLSATQDDIKALGAGQGQFSISKKGGGSVTVIVAGASAPQSPGGPNGGGGGTADSNTGCIGQQSPFDWLVCPVVEVMANTANKANEFITGQLNFDVNENLNHNEIKSAWAIFKNLVSVLIVILLLVMVISQAINAGPFDAYTVRKVLPKLVVAVIAMQLSWDISIWLIKLANEVGQGLAQLLAAPFGGVAMLDLEHLMDKLNPVYSATFGGAIGILLVGIGAYLYWPMFLLGAFTVFMAVLTAMATLLVRNALIILAVILGPLAFLFWAAPGAGAEKFWKLWKDNFSKALMLFPLVMLLIYGGRIFAWVAAGLGQAGPLDLIMVLAGFFGPYFFLPKTFKWGGSLLAQASSAINSASQKIGKNPNEQLRNLQKQWAEHRHDESRERVATNAPFRPRKFWQYPIDKVRSGQWNPLLGRPLRKESGPLGNNRLGRLLASEEGGWRRQHSVDAYVEQGEKSMQERVNAAEARLIRERQDIRARGGNHDIYLQAIAEGLSQYNDPGLGGMQTLTRRGREERMAARKQLAKLGAGMNWRYLEDYYERARATGGEEAADMRKFFDDNVELILPKLPHIYKSVAQAADADPAGIANMHGVEVEAILANLSRTINDPHTSTADRSAAQTSLTTFLQNFQRAVEGSKMGGPQLENGALRAAKAFLDRDDNTATDLLEEINGTPTRNEIHGRRAPGRAAAMPGELPRILPPLGRSRDLRLDPRPAAIIDGLRDSLAGTIDADGFVIDRRGAGPGGGAAPGGAAPAGGPGGAAPGGGVARGGTFGPSAELRIDHEALANTIREATHEGAYEGTRRALKGKGLDEGQPQRPGIIIPPGTTSVEPGFIPVDKKDNNVSDEG